MARYQRGQDWERMDGRRNIGKSLEKTLGRAVRNLRDESGMTQIRLAELSGMTQAAISRLEHGKCMPTFPLLERIAAAFDSVLLVAVEPGRGVSVAFGRPRCEGERAVASRAS
ncbi:helix-turn-helix domain-containing protein [Streptomyces mirabilis]|uniref:helix-turn-helix domain-containing protein n=1 Tax=Streptomyces mirabilis TaxID=68239 RepID=UPI00371A8B54